MCVGSEARQLQVIDEGTQSPNKCGLHVHRAEGEIRCRLHSSKLHVYKYGLVVASTKETRGRSDLPTGWHPREWPQIVDKCTTAAMTVNANS